MTIERLAFRAHQTDATLRPLRSEPIECDLKVPLPCHRLVVSDAVAIKRGVPRTAAEHFAVCEIGHAMLRQRRCQIFTGEPRQAARERRRADISNGVYAGMAQQPNEALGSNIRMADAEQIEGRHRRKSSGKAPAV